MNDKEAKRGLDDFTYHGQAVAIRKALNPDKEKIESPYCDGGITFCKDGCIYVSDQALADAIEIAIAIHGGVCIKRPDPGRPGKDVNMVC